MMLGFGKKYELNEPVVLVDNGNINNLISKLEYLKTQYKDIPEVVNWIDKDINNYQSGKKGEDNVMYALKTSYIPMYIMRNMYFKYRDDDSCQVDFIVITRKLILITECKNYSKNIRIDGETFIYEDEKTGFDSPYNQNMRHINFIRTMIENDESNDLKSLKKYTKNIDSLFKSLVVFSNKGAIIDKSNASEDIKNAVLRYDNLASHIEKLNKNSKMPEMSDDEMKKLADFFISRSTQNMTDYTSKYKKLAESHKPKPDYTSKYTKSADKPIQKSEPAGKKYKCPLCQKYLKQDDKGWSCPQHTDFRMNHNIYGHKMTKNDLIQLIETGSTEEYKFIGKSKKPFYAKLVVNEKTQKTEFEYNKLICPFCDKPLLRTKDEWKCENCKDFFIKSIISGHKMEESDVLDLIQKGETKEYNDFISKNGKKYKAKLKLNEGKIEFVFP